VETNQSSALVNFVDIKLLKESAI